MDSLRKGESGEKAMHPKELQRSVRLHAMNVGSFGMARQLGRRATNCGAPLLCRFNRLRASGYMTGHVTRPREDRGVLVTWKFA